MMVNPQEPQKQEICFDFTKGCCTRPFCKYSHDISDIIQVNSQERGICFDFLRNQCHRGLLCRFSHDLSSILIQQSQQGDMPAANRNAPICYDFVKGCCTRADCRYSHDISSVIHGAKSRPNSTDELCFDFLRGKCSRASACRYAHKRPVAGMAGLAPGLQMGVGIPAQPVGVPLLQPMPTHMGMPPQLQHPRAAINVLGHLSNMQFAAGPQQLPLVNRTGAALSGAPLNHDMVSQMAALQAFNSLRVAQQEAARQAAFLQATSMGMTGSHSGQWNPEMQAGPGDAPNGMAIMELQQKPQALQQDILADKLRAVKYSMQALSETVDEDTIGAHWERQVAGMPQLITSRLHSQPPSGACTPRTPALVPHHPFSIPNRAYQPSGLAPAANNAGANSDLSIHLAVGSGRQTVAQEQGTGPNQPAGHMVLPSVAKAASAPSSRRASFVPTNTFLMAGHEALSQPGTARAAQPEPRPASAAGLLSTAEEAAHEARAPSRTSCLLPTSTDDAQLMSRLHQIWGTQPMAAAMAKAC